MSGTPPEPGRRSRAYAATGGLVQDLEHDIGLDSQVVAVPGFTAPPSGSRRARAVELCREVRAVAELASRMDLPVGVVGAMVATLRAEGRVEVRAPLDMAADNNVTDALLRRVRAGLRRVI